MCGRSWPVALQTFRPQSSHGSPFGAWKIQPSVCLRGEMISGALTSGVVLGQVGEVHDGVVVKKEYEGKGGEDRCWEAQMNRKRLSCWGAWEVSVGSCVGSGGEVVYSVAGSRPWVF